MMGDHEIDNKKMVNEHRAEAEMKVKTMTQKKVVCGSCGEQIGACESEECENIENDRPLPFKSGDDIVCFPGGALQENHHFCDYECMHSYMDRNIFSTMAKSAKK